MRKIHTYNVMAHSANGSKVVARSVNSAKAMFLKQEIESRGFRAEVTDAGLAYRGMFSTPAKKDQD